MADLRDVNEADRAPAQTTIIDVDHTLRNFLDQLIKELESGRLRAQFIVVKFPNGEVEQIKYKFSTEVCISKNNTRYLDNYIERIETILDDGGLGKYVSVGEKTNAAC